MELKKSLAPVINSGSKVLILGSMPGEESLRRQQYYGFPGNQFWRLTAAVLRVPVPPDDYELRLEMLRAGGIALWDSIQSCTRDGSLDTMIRNEKPNDIMSVISNYGKKNGGCLAAVFFNGQKAASSFKRSFGFNSLEKENIYLEVLPSSSPAHTIKLEHKIEKWKVIADYL
ncbi:MAG TPA: DNA-deoxyinosine glycosylase [Spirochaeta sp.]|nr:DNA-deoxyinosine glycosylase [Spirochaeta sp.]